MFAERLNGLMELSGVTNAMLGRAVDMDSSHIGRLRRGARQLPKKHGFLLPMSRYFVLRLDKPYQRETLRSMTGLTAETLSPEALAEGLAAWLGEEETGGAFMGQLLRGLSGMAVQSLPPSAPLQLPREEPRQSYIGNPGKRQAVLRFFAEILAQPQPRTVWLFSDEDFSWLYEDAAFALTWKQLFLEVIRRGNKVKIAHTITRDVGEMLEGVGKWLPIYMTGAVEPCYYPRLRDGLFQRTLFIAPEVAAIVSSSVRQDVQGMLTLYLREPEELQALTRESRNFFALCRPLLHVCREWDAVFCRGADTLLSTPGEAIFYGESLPLFTLPEGETEALAPGCPLPLEALRRNSLDSLLRRGQAWHTSIITLPPGLPPEETAGLCRRTASLLQLEEGSYTPETRQRHLKGLEELTASCPGLTPVYREGLAKNVCIFAVEGSGALIASGSPGHVAFLLEEPRVAAAVWEYLQTEKSGRKAR